MFSRFISGSEVLTNGALPGSSRTWAVVFHELQIWCLLSKVKF